MGNVFSYVMKNNPSGALPYHSNFHLEKVCFYSIWLVGMHEGTISHEYSQYREPAFYERIIGAAALFHDWNHSGSGKDDDENIRRAQVGFENYCYEFYEDFTEEEKIFINRLIQVTRYPYIDKSENLTTLEKCIRDADILQGTSCENYLNGVVFALAREANIPFLSMLNGQAKFLIEMKFCLPYSQEIHNNYLPEILEDIKTIQQLFKS